MVKIWFPKKYIFHLLFYWKGIYYGLLYHKTCLGILISHLELQKMAKNVDFWKMENYCFWLKLEHFQEKCDPKPCIMMYLGYIHLIHMVPVTFGKKNSNHEKMAHFGLNWEESKWSGHFCSKVLYFFASKIGIKLPSEKKVPWHWRWPALGSWSNFHF